MSNDWLTSIDGLPPEGTECEVDICGEGFGWCKIVHHSGSASWIVTRYDDKIIRNDLAKFRPIKSERERAIDSAKKVTGYHVSEESLGYLYDAGLLREKPDA